MRVQIPLKYKLRFLSIIHLRPFKIQFWISLFTYVWTCAFSKANKKLYILLLGLNKGKLWAFVYAMLTSKYLLLWPDPKNSLSVLNRSNYILMMLQVISMKSVLAVCVYLYPSVLLNSVVKKTMSNSYTVRKTELGDLIKGF